MLPCQTRRARQLPAHQKASEALGSNHKTLTVATELLGAGGGGASVIAIHPRASSGHALSLHVTPCRGRSRVTDSASPKRFIVSLGHEVPEG